MGVSEGMSRPMDKKAMIFPDFGILTSRTQNVCSSRWNRMGFETVSDTRILVHEKMVRKPGSLRAHGFRIQSLGHFPRTNFCIFHGITKILTLFWRGLSAGGPSGRVILIAVHRHHSPFRPISCPSCANCLKQRQEQERRRALTRAKSTFV